MSTVSRTVQEAVEHYMTLPYARELVRNGDGTWFARIVEFTGCSDSQAEALANLEDAMSGWLEVSLLDGNPIPEPYGINPHRSAR